MTKKKICDLYLLNSDYYFTAVQWVNDGGVGGRAGSVEINEDKSGASAAEICVVWLNRAQNISVTTLCKSPMWMCQEVCNSSLHFTLCTQLYMCIIFHIQYE